MALWAAAAGIILPFGFGTIVSTVIHKFLLVEPHVNFGAFTLFMGVALCITAFPVLARILTERKLLNTEVLQYVPTFRSTPELNWYLTNLNHD